MLKRKKTLTRRANNSDYNGRIVISDSLIPDLLWWKYKIGKSFLSLQNKKIEIAISKDA